MGDYTTLAIPAFILGVFLLKYLFSRYFYRREARIQEERLRILRNFIITRHGSNGNSSSSGNIRESNPRPPSPPPEFESAIRNSIAISYIDLDDPPPSYEDYQKAQELLKAGPVSGSDDLTPPYVNNDSRSAAYTIDVETTKE